MEETLAAPEEDNGIHPVTGLPQYLEINKGITIGWNDCLEIKRRAEELLNN